MPIRKYSTKTPKHQVSVERFTGEWSGRAAPRPAITATCRTCGWTKHYANAEFGRQYAQDHADQFVAQH